MKKHFLRTKVVTSTDVDVFDAKVNDLIQNGYEVLGQLVVIEFKEANQVRAQIVYSIMMVQWVHHPTDEHDG